MTLLNASRNLEWDTPPCISDDRVNKRTSSIVYLGNTVVGNIYKIRVSVILNINIIINALIMINALIIILIFNDI